MVNGIETLLNSVRSIGGLRSPVADKSTHWNNGWIIAVRANCFHASETNAAVWTAIKLSKADLPEVGP